MRKKRKKEILSMKWQEKLQEKKLFLQVFYQLEFLFMLQEAQLLHVNFFLYIGF